MTEQTLVTEYNALCDKVQSQPNTDASKTLGSLTARELFVFIAAKTYTFGRSLTDSLKNAEYHMRDRSKAEKLFGQKLIDNMGGI